MRDYLRERYGLPAEKVTAEGKGEDWEGLREAVGRSDMKAKDEVWTSSTLTTFSTGVKSS